jgi:NSS family neurotransmitter:Na+ symporter
MDEFKMRRAPASYLAGVITTLLGVPSACALAGPEAGFFGREIFIKRNFFDFMDYISNNIMMPVTAIGICIFVGWAWAESARNEISNNGLEPFAPTGLWIWSARIIAPVAIGFILYGGI